MYIWEEQLAEKPHQQANLSNKKYNSQNIASHCPFQYIETREERTVTRNVRYFRCIEQEALKKYITIISYIVYVDIGNISCQQKTKRTAKNKFYPPTYLPKQLYCRFTQIN